MTRLGFPGVLLDEGQDWPVASKFHTESRPYSPYLTASLQLGKNWSVGSGSSPLHEETAYCGLFSRGTRVKARVKAFFAMGRITAKAKRNLIIFQQHSVFTFACNEVHTSGTTRPNFTKYRARCLCHGSVLVAVVGTPLSPLVAWRYAALVDSNIVALWQHNVIAAASIALMCVG